MSWLGIEDAREYALAETCAESPGKAHALEGGYQRLVQLSRHEGAGGAPGVEDCPATSVSMKARVKREALNYFVSGVIGAMAVLVARQAFKRILVSFNTVRSWLLCFANLETDSATMMEVLWSTSMTFYSVSLDSVLILEQWVEGYWRFGK